MPDTKITALTAISTVNPATYPLPIVDTADTTMAASGTTKKITVNQILGSGGTATLASATVTGDLTVDTSTLKVDSANDRVGVGTATPAAGTKFNVVGTVGTPVLFERTGSNGVYIALKDASGLFGYAGFSNGDLQFQTPGSGYANKYVIANDGTSTWSNVGGVAGTAMTLNSTGLGVGGSPSYKLSSIGTTNNQVVLHVGNTAGTVDGDTTNVVRFAAGSGANALWANARYDGFSHAWRCNSTTTEAMVLNSSGNVGIGVTPSAWGNAYKVVQTGQALGVYGRANLGYYGTKFNLYNDNTNDIAISTNFVGEYRFELLNGSHVWLNKPTAGSVGVAQTLTQAMTLDASGNLLVGVTSNPNTARAYFRYDTLTTQPVINSASIVAAATTWNHFVGQSGNGSTVTTNNIFIRGNGDIVNANGIYGTISDLRLKENISDARNYLADLLKLRVVKYSLKEEASAVANKLGFIAQEVEQVFPTMVDTDSEDTKSIKISVLIPMLVKAIQELTARVQTLETR